MLKICPICGKEFYTGQYIDYVYKRTIDGKILYFCGWNCMRKSDKEQEGKKKHD